ncbi:MAG: histidine phosphatase family protein [Bacteroidales bacterium]|nr:histidine phosphatase family protein [Bacteroidales bacterium]
MTTICIIRHGETDWNSSGRLQGCEDIELNDQGRLQAASLAAYLSRQPWDVIISSPLKRAYETAQIIASHISLPCLNVHEGLRERDYGEASGLLPDERHKRFPDGIIPGQEGFEHLRERAIRAIDEIAEQYSGKRIIVVAHGAFTNSILYTISGGEFGSFKTRLKNGCLNLIVQSNSQWSVSYYNKTVEELT